MDEVLSEEQKDSSVEAALLEANYDFEVIEHDKPIRTRADAEAYFKIEETAPTLILKTEDGYYALITSGKRKKVDFDYVKQLLGCANLNLASKSEVNRDLNIKTGQVPLIGHGLPTIIDNLLLNYDYVYGGLGHELRTLKIKPEDLIKINNVILYFD